MTLLDAARASRSTRSTGNAATARRTPSFTSHALRERFAWSPRFWATQVVVVLAGVAVYFGVRGFTAGSADTADRNAGFIVDLERVLHLDFELWLQGLVIGRDWLVTAANWVYIWGHWPVIAGVLGWLLVTRPERFLVYRDALLISGLVGIVIIAFFPMSPPRLLDLGFVDTVTEQSNSYRVLQPPAFVNQYAAMPSFHVGWDLLMGLALVRESRRLVPKIAGWLLPVLMVFAVMVTGNHFVMDGIVGDAVVLASLAAAGWLARRRAARRAVQEASAATSDAATTDPHSELEGRVSA